MFKTTRPEFVEAIIEVHVTRVLDGLDMSMNEKLLHKYLEDL